MGILSAPALAEIKRASPRQCRIARATIERMFNTLTGPMPMAAVIDGHKVRVRQAHHPFSSTGYTVETCAHVPQSAKTRIDNTQYLMTQIRRGLGPSYRQRTVVLTEMTRKPNRRFEFAGTVQQGAGQPVPFKGMISDKAAMLSVLRHVKDGQGSPITGGAHMFWRAGQAKVHVLATQGADLQPSFKNLAFSSTGSFEVRRRTPRTLSPRWLAEMTGELNGVLNLAGH